MPVPGAEVAFRLDRELLPEGIAWDPVEERLFLSSTWRRKVVRIDASGRPGTSSGRRRRGCSAPSESRSTPAGVGSGWRTRAAAWGFVDLASGATERLAAPEGITLAGIDGLERDGDSLVALQALAGVDQVRRFRLDDTGSRVESADVLVRDGPRFVQPTTGVVARDRFCFVGTSQFGAVGPEGLDEDALVDTLVMWVPLAR